MTLAQMPAADRNPGPSGPFPVTAQDNLKNYGESEADTASRAAAQAAGLVSAAFINYDAKLDAYSARPDVEDLAHKNARNSPNDFSEANFMRRAVSDPSTSHVSGTAPLS